MCLKTELKIYQECMKIEYSSYMKEFWHEVFVFVFFLSYCIIFNLSFLWTIRYCLDVYFIIRLISVDY